jgi:trimeric autotransporter adhesin
MKPTIQISTALSLFAISRLYAATFTVTNTSDAAGISTCVAPIECSLRQAITRANSTSAVDTIAFAIPGTGPHSISPSTELPAITEPVLIDGYTQSGAIANTSSTGFNAVLKIQLNGANIQTASTGLQLQAATSTSIRGLSITGFAGASNSKAIELNGAGAATITGCAIGVTPAFVAAANASGISSGPNQTGAVRIGTLSTTTHSSVNLISQNMQFGVALGVVNGAQTGSSFIGRNLINVSATGGTFLSSLVSVFDNRGATTISGNIIGGARPLGLLASGFMVTSNRIGGTEVPIRIVAGASGVGTIGGMGVLANTIGIAGPAGATSQIVHLGSGMNIDFSLNRFLATGTRLGIDLEGNGPTANDLGDGDGGANGQQNFPELTVATRTSPGGLVSISGTLNSLANRSFRLAFYGNLTPVRAGEFLGDITTEVSTDASGNASFGPLQVNFGNGAALMSHASATATLIDNTSNLAFATSEFAAPIEVLLAAPPAAFVVTTIDDPGDGVCDASCTLREAVVAANGVGGPTTSIDEIRFNIPGAGPHTITLTSALPGLTQSVTMDGYTQPGALTNTDATGVGTNAALKIEIRAIPGATFPLFASDSVADNITLRGLAINSFNTIAPVNFRDATNVRIEGNWFGVRPNGEEAFTSLPLAFSLGSTVFGGPSPAERNIWNNANRLVFSEQASTQVTNSLFGVMPSGRVAASVSTASNNTISLTMLGSSASTVNCDKNVFATAPTGSALAASFGQIFDNAFGESFDGQSVLTLGRAIIVSADAAAVADSVRIDSATHRIRNPTRDAVFVAFGRLNLAQDIVGGAARGVVVESADAAVSIRSAIVATGLGIDLGDNGVTLNDLGDIDPGLQNFPVLTSATGTGNTVTVTGRLNSLPNKNFRILLCATSTQHNSLHGGCDRVLDDETIVTTSAQGNTFFSVTVEDDGQPFITATASRIISATEEQSSEYALNIPVARTQADSFANGFEGL